VFDMNGKELALTLLGAGLVGGAAGLAASSWNAPSDAPSAALAADAAARLERVEDALARTNAAFDDLKKSNALVQERLTSTEIKAARDAAEAGVAAAPGARPARPGRRIRLGDAAAGGTGDDAGPQTATGPDVMDGLPGSAAIDLGVVLDGDAMPAEFGSFRKAMELRKLPEDQRWRKAKDDLGLTWNQVEDLKKAVAARDAAMKDAMVTEKSETGNGGAFSFSRPDPGKSAHAQADYHDAVAKSLDENQKKSWKDKGYESAFGGSPFGGVGSVMMAIDVRGDGRGDAPPK